MLGTLSEFLRGLGEVGHLILALVHAAGPNHGSVTVSRDEAVITFPQLDPDTVGTFVKDYCFLADYEDVSPEQAERLRRDCVAHWSYQWVALLQPPMGKILDALRVPLQRGSGMDGYLLEVEVSSPVPLSGGESELAEAVRGGRADVDEVCCHGGRIDTMPGAQVTAAVEDGRVVLRLHGGAAVARVFAQRRRWLLLGWPNRSEVIRPMFVRVRYRYW